MPKTFTYEQKALAAEIVRAYQACAGNVSQAAVQCGRNRSTVQSYLKYWREGAFDGLDEIPAYAEPVSSLKHISANDGELSQATPVQTPDWMLAMAEHYAKQGLPVPALPGLPAIVRPEQPEPRHSTNAPEVIGSEFIESDGVYRVLVTPDCQLPYEDEIAMNVVEQYAADHKFDEWIDLGDYLDLDFLSRYNIGNHRANANKKLREHYDYGREVLDRRLKILRSNNPKAKMTIIEGNHDFRVESFLDTQPAMEGLIEVAEGLELKQKDVQWIRFWRDKSLYRIGKALFAHGLYTSKFHAEKMVNNYGDNIFYGHTHDVQEFPKVLRGRDKTIVGQSLGCLCRYDQSYIKGAPTNWQQAFGEFWFFPDGHFTYYVPRIFKGRFIAPDGKVYIGKGAKS